MVVRCDKCGAIWQIEEDDPDVRLMPYPHIVCGCGNCIPLF